MDREQKFGIARLAVAMTLITALCSLLIVESEGMMGTLLFGALGWIVGTMLVAYVTVLIVDWKTEKKDEN